MQKKSSKTFKNDEISIIFDGGLGSDNFGKLGHPSKIYENDWEKLEIQTKVRIFHQNCEKIEISHDGLESDKLKN